MQGAEAGRFLCKPYRSSCIDGQQYGLLFGGAGTGSTLPRRAPSTPPCARCCCPTESRLACTALCSSAHALMPECCTASSARVGLALRRSEQSEAAPRIIIWDYEPPPAAPLIHNYELSYLLPHLIHSHLPFPTVHLYTKNVLCLPLPYRCCVQTGPSASFRCTC